MTSVYGSTSGSDERESRSLMAGLMPFNLSAEAVALRKEDPYTSGDRNSRTLAKAVDFRVVLSVLRPHAELDEQAGGARASIHVLEGEAVLRVQDEQAELSPWHMAVVDAGRPWTLRAASDCVVLLTLTWPGDSS